MDLRDILNPVDLEPRSQGSSASQQTTQANTATSASQGPIGANEDDQAVSDVSTDSDDDEIFKTPGKHHRGSSDTAASTIPSVDRRTKSVESPFVVLSPCSSQIYNRRVSTSPTRVPTLLPPLRRVLNKEFSLPVHQSGVDDFSVFNALLNYTELTLEVAKNLDIEDLISLYAISQDFHKLVNARFTAMIKAQWQSKAPESGRIFAPKCYRNLTIRDPACRINESKPNQVRDIPSFRWLRMVLYREEVVNNILRCLLNAGHRMPRSASLAIKKVWFTMDIPDNARRIGLMHNEAFWTGNDLFMATMFFLKLDMHLTDPNSGNGEMGLRKMLLGQRSMSTLMRALKREEMRTQVELLRMIVRYSYSPGQQTDTPIMGIPGKDVGRLRYEGWGEGQRLFVPVDELVMKEAIRRKMRLYDFYTDMMIWGYINKKTWQDVRTPMPAKVTDLHDLDSEDEWTDDDDDDDDEKFGYEKRLFADDSGDDEGNGDDEAENEDDMDLKKYRLSAKAKGKMAQGRGSRTATAGLHLHTWDGWIFQDFRR
ncbi:hypothetical protein ACLMJK_001266 [Lecanora helva]